MYGRGRLTICLAWQVWLKQITLYFQTCSLLAKCWIEREREREGKGREK